jgi:3-oxoacyl-[acyl-carrier protein] reductase
MTAPLSEALKEQYQQRIPLRRFGSVDEVAKVVSFLASDDSAYITGQVIAVDGGLSM